MPSPRTGAAIRQAGALAALAAASALMGFFIPAVEARAHAHAHVVLALHAITLLGCAAVLLSPAHGAVADLARRATEAALGAPAGLLRWLGFAGIALYVAGPGDVDARTEAAAWPAPGMVKGFLLFVVFLVGVWAICLSMIRERGGPPRPPATAAAAEPEASWDRAEVWAVFSAMVAVGTGKGCGGPPAAAAEEDHDGAEVEVNATTLRPACVAAVVVDT